MFNNERKATGEGEKKENRIEKKSLGKEGKIDGGDTANDFLDREMSESDFYYLFLNS